MPNAKSRGHFYFPPAQTRQKINPLRREDYLESIVLAPAAWRTVVTGTGFGRAPKTERRIGLAGLFDPAAAAAFVASLLCATAAMTFIDAATTATRTTLVLGK
jgi:hypothetical protein